MSYQVRALYEFNGEPNSSELTINADEILTVTRIDVGEGWWEGVNSSGKMGLFPASYVEKITPAPVSTPAAPPVAPPPQGNRYDPTADDWGESTQYSAPPQNYAKGDGEGWEDDWDDDTYSEIGPGGHPSQGNAAHRQQSQEVPNYPLPGMPINDINNEDTLSNYNGPHSGSVTKKNNRFSTFSKSGGESYILGTFNATVIDSDKVFVHQTDDGYSWSQNTNPYHVIVASPKKESKFKGIKSYIAYQITPSFNNIQVSRRYKHFDWLHERLTEKFCLIPIPPLPDKQISGRYEEQFIEHRRIQLQEFIDWVCRHPVLSRCDVLQHFLTCTDEKRWKAGKRQAEKDLLVGANYCVTIFPPEKALLPSQVDPQTEQFNNFIHHMDSAVKILMATCLDQTKKNQGPYKREYQKIGESFFSLGNALGFDEGGSLISTSKLTAAIRKTGGTYIDIGKLFEEQPKHDWEPLSDKLHIYKGIIGSFPDVLAAQKSAIQKRKECEKLTTDRKMEVIQLNEVIKRTDVVTYALLAEMNHFKTERTVDLKAAMQQYLTEQIKFYKNIVGKLESALNHFDET
ncbi:sorting nexin 33-like protein SH3PX1 [Arctopsyche grandis]|uniref:sorting nexin 33-like protein SH3PX1 n=1 Tax=Arctopsyche grandis TaxID=121162 RepID=UPI00406D702E